MCIENLAITRRNIFCYQFKIKFPHGFFFNDISKQFFNKLFLFKKLFCFYFSTVFLLQVCIFIETVDYS
jgi:hypothetical protein